jgi:hypothetical protein
MKVKELIEILKQLDQEKELRFSGQEDCYLYEQIDRNYSLDTEFDNLYGDIVFPALEE